MPETEETDNESRSEPDKAEEPVYEYRVNLYHPNAGLKTWRADKDFSLAVGMLETARRFDPKSTLERRVYTPWEKVEPE